MNRVNFTKMSLAKPRQADFKESHIALENRGHSTSGVGAGVTDKCFLGKNLNEPSRVLNFIRA